MRIDTLFWCVVIGIGIGMALPQIEVTSASVRLNEAESILSQNDVIKQQITNDSKAEPPVNSASEIKKRLNLPDQNKRPDSTTGKGMKALLWTLQLAEGTRKVDSNQCFTNSSTEPYRTIFGDTVLPLSAKLWSDHPRILQRKWGTASDAAGAYQFLSPTWDSLIHNTNIKDFTPASQDIAAIKLIKNTINNPAEIVSIEAGILPNQSVFKLARQWSSLPGPSGYSLYGQGAKSLNFIQNTYTNCFNHLNSTFL